MKVIAPHTRVVPEVTDALDACTVEWTPVFLRYPEHYYDLLHALWDSGEDFIIVEHDIVIHGNVLWEFEQCPSDWCAFPYSYLHGYHYGLGCVRFTADLIERHRGAIERIATMSDADHPPKHYCRLDGWLAQVLTREGETLCQHWPMVEHLQSNPGHSGHGCI